jgi:hypothetical protein
MLDAQLDLQGLRSDRFSADFYTKFESSPQMDYHGPGLDSLEENRTSYAYDTFSMDIRVGLNVTDWLRLGEPSGGSTPTREPASGAGCTRPMRSSTPRSHLHALSSSRPGPQVATPALLAMGVPTV